MDIQIYRLTKNTHQDSNTKAFVDLLIDGELVLKGLKLVEGREGLFLACPSEKNKEGKYFDNMRFLIPETKAAIEKVAIDRFNLSEKVSIVKKESIVLNQVEGEKSNENNN